MSANLSAAVLRPGLAGEVADGLEETGSVRAHLTLEAAGSDFIENVPRTIALLRSPKVSGVEFTIDDLGVGCSSLSYLKRLPANYFNIDCSIAASS
jgi:EAL domain-containing protein (putative c-di-GMP-specific phosphodiesterase class I)